MEIENKLKAMGLELPSVTPPPPGRAGAAKLLCMINSAPDFGQQPQVANGATDLLSELYGEAGVHARSAVGLAALPNGACIEIEMIMEVED